MDWMATDEPIALSSYAVNGAEYSRQMKTGRRISLGLFGRKFPLSSIRRPGRTCLAIESSNYDKVADLDHPNAIAAFDNARDSAALGWAKTRYHHRVTSGFYHDGNMNIVYADSHVARRQGIKTESLPLGEWPAGPKLNPACAFLPDLALPSAADDASFWGPPYE